MPWVQNLPYARPSGAGSQLFRSEQGEDIKPWKTVSLSVAVAQNWAILLNNNEDMSFYTIQLPAPSEEQYYAISDIVVPKDTDLTTVDVLLYNKDPRYGGYIMQVEDWKWSDDDHDAGSDWTDMAYFVPDLTDKRWVEKQVVPMGTVFKKHHDATFNRTPASFILPHRRYVAPYGTAALRNKPGINLYTSLDPNIMNVWRVNPYSSMWLFSEHAVHGGNGTGADTKFQFYNIVSDIDVLAPPTDTFAGHSFRVVRYNSENTTKQYWKVTATNKIVYNGSKSEAHIFKVKTIVAPTDRYSRYKLTVSGIAISVSNDNVPITCEVGTAKETIMEVATVSCRYPMSIKIGTLASITTELGDGTAVVGSSDSNEETQQKWYFEKVDTNTAPTPTPAPTPGGTTTTTTPTTTAAGAELVKDSKFCLKGTGTNSTKYLVGASAGGRGQLSLSESVQNAVIFTVSSTTTESGYLFHTCSPLLGLDNSTANTAAAVDGSGKYFIGFPKMNTNTNVSVNFLNLILGTTGSPVMTSVAAWDPIWTIANVPSGVTAAPTGTAPNAVATPIANPTGTPGTSTNPTVVTGTTKPSAPRDVVFKTTATAGEATVSWLPPTTGAPIDNYLLKIPQLGADVTTVSSSPHKITGLNSSITYTASMAAVNTAGEGEYSIAVEITADGTTKTTAAPQPPADPAKKSKLSTGAIIGIAASFLAVIGILYYWKKSQKRPMQPMQSRAQSFSRQVSSYAAPQQPIMIATQPQLSPQYADAAQSAFVGAMSSRFQGNPTVQRAQSIMQLFPPR